jgi:superfamily II DNA or RNA helicase
MKPQIQKREYQERDYKQIETLWSKGKQPMYQLPTGGGKSVVVSKVVESHHTENIIFIAHRRELLFQMVKRLRGMGYRVGLIVGDIKEEVDSNILVISIQTLVRGQFDTTL